MREIISQGCLNRAAAANVDHEFSSASIPGVRKIKGIQKRITKNEMGMVDYESVLTNLDTQRHVMHIIRSRNHHLYIEQQEKISLSILEDKRLDLK